MSLTAENEGLPRVEDPDAVRAEWLGRLNDLAARVKGWVEPAGWRTRLVSKPTRDSELGRFEVPLLLMEREGVQIALNPVSRFVSDSDGAVELYVVPAYDVIASLYSDGGVWTLYHVFPDPEGREIRDPEPISLSEGAINRVLDEMAARVA